MKTTFAILRVPVWTPLIVVLGSLGLVTSAFAIVGSDGGGLGGGGGTPSPLAFSETTGGDLSGSGASPTALTFALVLAIRPAPCGRSSSR